MGYSPRGHKESDMTERLTLSLKRQEPQQWVYTRRAREAEKT